jgi:BASS family bile acid:Na+ symporter
MKASPRAKLLLLLWIVATASNHVHCFTPVNLSASRKVHVHARSSVSSLALQRQHSSPSRIILLDKMYASASPSAVDEAGSNDKKPLLDQVLSKLTSAFPLFVLSSAILALIKPVSLQWVNQGNLISIMLMLVMCGTGLTLERKDFANVLGKDWASVPLGVLCQFLIMPLSAWAIGKTFLLPAAAAAGGDKVGSALFLGLCLVGCSPGGTASNLVALIANADVALSVILTACSTMLAVVATPLLVKLLVGSEIAISGMALVQATARVVLLPVLLGMVLNDRVPKLAKAVSRFTPFASVLLVAVICGGVVAQNAPLLLQSSTGAAASATVGLPVIVGSVLILHTLGFAAGYLIPKFGFGRSEKSARTISIEVGMQNSALAVVLARSIGAHPLASLPGALSATVHSCLGSGLAAYWRLQESSSLKRAAAAAAAAQKDERNGGAPDFPDFQI